MPLALPSGAASSSGSSTAGSASRGSSSTSSPPSSAGSSPAAQEGSMPASTFLASLSRTLLFVWGMMLKRPSRLFRPSRISSITFLRALAKRDNLTLSPRGLYRLARSYGPWSLVLPLVPPIILNTVLTTLLFTTHSGLVALLSKCEPFRHKPPVVPSSDESAGDEGRETVIPEPEPAERPWYVRNPHGVRHPTAVSALAGFGAGVVQSTLAIPVERGVKVVGRVIAGSGTDSKSGTSSSSSASQTAMAKGKAGAAPRLSSTASLLPASTEPPPQAVPGSAKARTATLAWLKELRSTGIASSSPLTAAGGWRHVSKLGFEGWRWGAAKDGVGYAIFFATFDTSRRLALHVRSLVSSVQSTAALHPARTADRPRVRAFFGLEDGRAGRADEDDEEGALGYEGSRWARISQALVLVAGGMLAGQLFLLSTRPFDAVLRLLASPAHLPSSSASRTFTRAYVLDHVRHPLHPHRRSARYRTHTLVASAKPLPAIPLIAKTIKTKGWGWLVRPPKGEGVGARGGSWAGRLGWTLVKVGPWGGGFLAFAWLGGEI